MNRDSRNPEVSEELLSGARHWIVREMQGRRLKVEGPVVPRDTLTGFREVSVISVADAEAALDSARADENTRVVASMHEQVRSFRAEADARDAEARQAQDDIDRARLKSSASAWRVAAVSLETALATLDGEETL